MDGYLQATNFDTYLIPTARDVPDITCILLEMPYSHGPFGAKNIAEPALVPVAPGHLQRHRTCHRPAGARFASQPGTRAAGPQPRARR